MQSFEIPEAPTIKQQKPVDRRAYTIVPIRVVKDKRIRVAAYRVLLAICSYANRAGLCWPSHINLGKDLGVSRQAVSRQLKKLIDYGYLVKVKQFQMKRTAQIYRVIYDEKLSNKQLLQTANFDDLHPSHQEKTIKETLKAIAKCELKTDEHVTINSVALTANIDKVEGLKVNEACGLWLKACSVIGIARQITDADKHSLSVLASSGVDLDTFKQAVDDVLVDWQAYRREPPHRLSYFLRLAPRAGA
jgi:biotin operon repressor